MYFYKAYGLRISSEIELPELSADEAGASIDLVIKLGEVILPGLFKTTIHRRGIQAYFGQLDDQLFLNWEGIAAFKAVDAKVLTINPYTKDPNLLSLFTVSEAIGLILFQKGHFLLHASSVQVGEEAWVFMGNPGAGKSSTAAAFIKAGCRMLSDDLTAINFDSSGSPYIIPAYPQLKIWENTVNGLAYTKSSLVPVSEGVNKFSFQPKDNFSHEPIRLGQVFFIHKAKNRPILRSLVPSDIPVKMLRNFPLPIQLVKNEHLKQHFLQSFKCASSAKIWDKRRPDGFENLQKWVAQSLEKHSFGKNG
ncbi:serine kinase [Dyadobacter sp. 32]|uniref:serine kinase n=1 Tax=Dyadobacter sp. 32 TaxID=538966 RepID=UPI0011EF0E36